MHADVDAILQKLHDVRQEGSGWKALCPAHDDKRGSLKIDIGDDGRVLLKCFAGCDTKAICSALGIAMRNLFPKDDKASGQRKGAGKKPLKIIARYVYSSADGKPLFRVCRTDDKRFIQERALPGGGYKPGLAGLTPVLYRLPEVLKAIQAGERIYLVEGEKDADNLVKLGLCAATAPMGAGKWIIQKRGSIQNHYSESLRSARVIILPDNDNPGREHALQVAVALQGIASEVRIVELPNLPPKGDVSDWIEGARGRGGDAAKIAEELELLASEATLFQNQTDVRSLPGINAQEQDLRVLNRLTWEAVNLANNPPYLFRFGGKPARLDRNDSGQTVVSILDRYETRHELSKVADWIIERRKKNGDCIETPAMVPMDAVHEVLATADPPLPILTRITEVPVFAPDGSISLQPGYHAAGQVYHQPCRGLEIPDVSETPSEAEVEKARDLLLELVCDMKFVDQSDCANSIALLLLPFLRDLIPGPTPNHLIEAPSPGSGKGLLADVLILPAAGEKVGLITEGRDDDEWRKRITSILCTSPVFVRLDNITRTLDSGSLAAALTATIWGDRVMGKTKWMDIAVRCAWVTTANNPTMSTEIARRCVRIRIDPRMDRPWLREGFLHDPLKDWVSEHRGELIWAALTLGRNWLAQDRPAPSLRPLGSYEHWSKVVGGVLQCAGIPGFLTNLDEFYEKADLEGAKWRAFVEVWYERFGTEEVGTADLFPLAEEMDSFNLGRGGERSQRTSFGKQLGKQRDRVIGSYRIVSLGTVQRAGKWMLSPTNNLFEAGNDVNVVNVCEHSHLLPYAREGNKDTSYIQGGENVHECSQRSHDEEEPIDPDTWIDPDV